MCARLTGLWAFGDPLYRSTGVTDAHCHTGFIWVLRILSQILALHGKCLTHWAVSPAQILHFEDESQMTPSCSPLSVAYLCLLVLLFQAALMPHPLIVPASSSRRRDAFLFECPWQLYCTHIMASALLSCLLFTLPFFISHYKPIVASVKSQPCVPQTICHSPLCLRLAWVFRQLTMSVGHAVRESVITRGINVNTELRNFMTEY